MFDIHSGSPHALWVPVDTAAGSFDTLYTGQLVQSGTDGVIPLAAAIGAYDTTTEAVPFGAVIGTNKRNPSFSTTSNSESITSASPHASTTEYAMMEGMYPKGDLAALVKVGLILPQTIIKGNIFFSTIGTAPTVGTVTAAGVSTTGAGFTSSTFGVDTPVTNSHTVYFRSGANRGVYRVPYSTSATVVTVRSYFPFDIAAGDTVVGCNLKVGRCKGQTDAESVFLDGAITLAANYWDLNVLWMDLSVPGKCVAYFQFGAIHFVGAARA
jgi:hypothetical protein